MPFQDCRSGQGGGDGLGPGRKGDRGQGFRGFGDGQRLDTADLQVAMRAMHLAAKNLPTDAILADAPNAAPNAARDAAPLAGRRHRPRCCRRTLAAIASGMAGTKGAASAASAAL